MKPIPPRSPITQYNLEGCAQAAVAHEARFRESAALPVFPGCLASVFGCFWFVCLVRLFGACAKNMAPERGRHWVSLLFGFHNPSAPVLYGSGTALDGRPLVLIDLQPSPSKQPGALRFGGCNLSRVHPLIPLRRKQPSALRF